MARNGRSRRLVGEGQRDLQGCLIGDLRRMLLFLGFHNNKTGAAYDNNHCGR